MKNDLEPGDMIRWKDTMVDPPVERHGTVEATLSMQYLVLDSEGRQTFVFKKDVKA